MAVDPDPDTHNPRAHPYPLCCHFFKQILLKRSWKTVHSVWWRKVEIPLPLRGGGICQVLRWPLLRLLPGVLVPRVWSTLTQSRLLSLTVCIQVPSSRSGPEYNVTSSSSCLLPPPCFKALFQLRVTTNKPGEKEWERGARVWERREICGDLGSQSGRPPVSYWDYIYFLKSAARPVACGLRGWVCMVIKLQLWLCG